MNPAFPPENQESGSVAEGLLSLMLLVQQKLIKPSEQITRNHLSPTQFQALGTMAMGGPLTMSELAGSLGISKQQLTPVIDRLERDRLVTREGDTVDRRVIRLRVSGDGMTYLAKMKVEFEALVTKQISPLEAGDQTDLLGALNTIKRVLGKLP